MSTLNSCGGSTVMWKSTASPGATAPVEMKPLIWRRTSSAERGPPAARGAGTRGVFGESPDDDCWGASTYQGSTWRVSARYVSLPRGQGTAAWPQGSVT